MGHYNSDSQDNEFVTAISAAAFTIHSYEEAKLQQYQKGKDSVQITRTKSLQDTTTGRGNSGDMTRRLPNKEETTSGGASMKRSMGQDKKTSESGVPSRYPNRTSSKRPSTSADGHPNRSRSSEGRNSGDTKADAWENAEMKKIQKRYEKVKSAIVAWENEKKMQAKLKMDRRKSELEHRKARNMQHYQMKQERIDQIAGGARAQIEEKRRNEEAKVKEKVKRIRSTRKVPSACFCFTCH